MIVYPPLPILCCCHLDKEGSQAEHEVLLHAKMEHLFTISPLILYIVSYFSNSYLLHYSYYCVAHLLLLPLISQSYKKNVVV